MTILISGYYGFNNVGDELILSSLIKMLEPHKKKLVVLSHCPRATRKIHGIRAVSRWNPLRVLWELMRCKILISGGGGLIQDQSGPYSPVYYLGIIRLAQILKKKIIVFGQGIGPLLRSKNRQLTARVFNQLKDCWVRDRGSWEECQALGILPGKLRLGADLVWFLPVAADKPLGKWSICLRADGLAGSIPDWVYHLQRLAVQQAKQLTFVAMGNRGDCELLARLQRDPLLQNGQFVDATRPEIYQTGAEIFSGSELVISMRYHGLVLGALAGAVVMGVGSDPKLANLLRELGQPHLQPDNSEILLNSVFNYLPELNRIVREKRKFMRQDVLASKDFLLEWVNTAYHGQV